MESSRDAPIEADLERVVVASFGGSVMAAVELLLRSGRPHVALAQENRRLRVEVRALRYAVTHDALTGLLSRRGAEMLAGRLLDRTGSGVVVSTMLLDLNGFKQVNDELGHDVGDRVLQEIGARLSAHAGRRWQILARLGGDEFVGLRAGADHPQLVRTEATWLAQRLSAPMQVVGHVLQVGAAIGLAMTDTPTSLGVLLRRADEAMYQAKAQAGGVVLWRQPGLRAGTIRRGGAGRIHERNPEPIHRRSAHRPADTSDGKSCTGLTGPMTSELITDGGE